MSPQMGSIYFFEKSKSFYDKFVKQFMYFSVTLWALYFYMTKVLNLNFEDEKTEGY